MFSKPLPRRPELDALLAKVKDLPPMTPAQIKEQRISFAYGNVSMSNPRITKDMVREADGRIHGIPQDDSKEPS